MVEGRARAIADDLEVRIRGGEFKPGDRLPSQQELAAEFGVHRDTAARAYDFLKDRGVARGVAGVGVYVRRADQLRKALARWRPPPDDDGPADQG